MDGTVWSISNTSGGAVNRFDGESWTHFRLTPLGGNDIHTSLLERKDGTLWIGSLGGVLHVFRNHTWHIYKPPDIPTPAVRIIDLLEASDGALWLAGLGQEVGRLDDGISRWMTYEGLRFQCESSDGTLWFLSSDGKVVRREGGTWVSYGTADGLMDNPSKMLVTREGIVWVAGSHQAQTATAYFEPFALSAQVKP